ncbi:DUF6059 family protein [Streptomyces sp. NPDC020362]|uniref:DUF6059 family protein n=1 Tax=unclassified Streptomyces TaxID=2593676 RepID=UPI000AF61AE8
MTARRILRAVYRALVASGRMYVTVPRDDTEHRTPDIPHWHPERLRPDVPFSDSERVLFGQLRKGGE